MTTRNGWNKAERSWIDFSGPILTTGEIAEVLELCYHELLVHFFNIAVNGFEARSNARRNRNFGGSMVLMKWKKTWSRTLCL